MRISDWSSDVCSSDLTRSISVNGLSQVTAIFQEETDIYFARQQVGERLSDAKELLPPGLTPTMGPISTGLGAVYMWTVEFEPFVEREAQADRPEERRVGKECVRTCSTRCAPSHSKKIKQEKT